MENKDKEKINKKQDSIEFKKKLKEQVDSVKNMFEKYDESNEKTNKIGL